MLQRSKTIFLLLLSVTFGAAGLAAQDDNRGWKDFQFIKDSEAWLNSYNAAGLKALPVEKLSIVEISTEKGNGDFLNYYQSDNHIQFGALTESFYRLTPKTVLYGKVEYSNFVGKNMSGSAFIDPYYNPFDITEYEEGNPGKKKLETYNLTGAVSADVYKGLTLGGKVDYTVANYAKEKDLRHKNKLFDMALTAGLSYLFNPAVEVGANYFFRRSTEGLVFKAYGTTDKQYYSLIGYGAFYGISEPFGDVGYTKENEDNPMVNDFHGVSLQMNLNIGKAFTWFNEITCKSRNGYYGKHAPSKIVYTNHDGNVMEYNGTLSFRQKKNLHQLKVTAGHERLKNYERIYRTEQQPNGNNEIVYYGSVKTTNRQVQNVKVEYTGNLGVEDFNPAWTLKAGMNYFSREQIASVYPYYRKQDIHSTTLNLSAARNIVKNKDMYSFYLGLSYGLGGGVMKADETYATPSDEQTVPASAERYLQQEYEYLTNDRFTGETAFRYSRLFDNVNMKGYASIGYKLTKASDIVYLPGDKYHQFYLTIGCSF
jgi:hypothetical protein